METNCIFLVIEDNQIDQFIITQLFKKKLDVSEINIASNGKEGIEWIVDNRKKNDAPLVILLDIQMPVMTGIEFLLEYEKLEDELKRDTQIFMLSSSLNTDEIQRLKENVYVTDFLSKPIAMEELSEKIDYYYQK